MTTPGATEAVTPEQEIVARAICKARGHYPETLHQNYGPDEPVDAVLSTGATAHYGWRHHVAVAQAAIEAIRSLLPKEEGKAPDAPR